MAPAIIRPSVRRHSIKVELCTPAIGAELSNISLADAALDPDAIAEIRALWLKHKVLFFRDQNISPMEQQNFAAQFAELEAHPLAPSHPEADKLLMLYRNLDPSKPKNYVEKASRENIWHADVTYKKAPPRGAVLRCELGPETGGDTMWSNMVMAYENLPDAVKQRIAGLYAKHDAEHTFGAQLPIADRHAMAAKNPAAEHPVVLTHPETGEKVLFVNSAFTTHFSNFFNFEDIRYGQDFMPEAHHADELPDLPGRDSGVPGASEVENQHGCHVGQPAGSTLRRGGLRQCAKKDASRHPRGYPAGLSLRFPPANPPRPPRDRRAALARSPIFDLIIKETDMLFEQIDTAVIDGESLPWVPLTPYSNDILLKYFKLDPIRGEWIVLMKVPAGAQLPKHHHTGTVTVYTIEGKWKYIEHDWVAGPGSLVYETAASTHTFTVVAEGESGHVITLVTVSGDLLFLDDKDNVVALENWKTSLQRYLAYCEQHGIEPKDLTAFN